MERIYPVEPLDRVKPIGSTGSMGSTVSMGSTGEGRNGIGRREKWPKKSRKEGEIGENVGRGEKMKCWK